MTTGRIDYSPDYKSDFEASIREGKSVAEAMLSANEKATERTRLEHEAIAHLLTWRTTKDVSTRSEAWHGLMKAADELVKLEKEKK